MCTQSTAMCQGLQTGALVPHLCQKGNWNKASLFHQAPNGNKAADACSLQECSTHPSWLLKTPSAVGSLPSKELYIFLLQRVVCLSICLTDWEPLALEFQRGHLKLPPHIRTLVHLVQYCDNQLWLSKGLYWCLSLFYMEIAGSELGNFCYLLHLKKIRALSLMGPNRVQAVHI